MSMKRPGRRARVHVFPPPPLKFRTVGFPQYGFKRGVMRDLRPGTYTRTKLATGPPWPQAARASRSAGPAPRPEALGSPPGSVVPAGHRVLWPHPSLSRPPVDLCLYRQVFAAAGRERVPNLLCVSLPSCHLCTPADRTVAHGCRFTVHSGLHRLRIGSASANPAHSGPARRVTRLIEFAFATARWVASPAPARTFTFELSPRESPQRGVEYDYAGRQPAPAAGLPPARHAALWAANEDHEEGIENAARVSACPPVRRAAQGGSRGLKPPRYECEATI